MATAWLVVVFAAAVGVAGVAVPSVALCSRIAGVRRCGRILIEETRSDSHG